jgi:hypothetical protein
MAIIRPLEGPDRAEQVERPGTHRLPHRSEDQGAVAFHLPESVWDIDAVPFEEAQDSEPHGLDPAEATARRNHPSLWSASPSPTPLAVVRPEEPSAGVDAPDPWVRSIVDAATSARAVDTADAWRGVARAADLVSEMARALEVVADAVQEAVDAQATARQAREAAEASARRAEAATARARVLEAAVEVARRLNSPESWGEVRRAAMGDAREGTRGMSRSPSPGVA